MTTFLARIYQQRSVGKKNALYSSSTSLKLLAELTVEGENKRRVLTRCSHDQDAREQLLASFAASKRVDRSRKLDFSVVLAQNKTTQHYKTYLARRALLHLLEVERDPHAVDNNNTLADQLLVRNV